MYAFIVESNILKTSEFLFSEVNIAFLSQITTNAFMLSLILLLLQLKYFLLSANTN